MNLYTKKHLVSLLGYLGIGFISWSISHWFFSGTRSIIMASIWILLFITSEYLKEGQKNYKELIAWGLVYSVAVGIVSGGFQHFLDSPMRSLWIIPVGWFISTLIFPLKEGLKNYNYSKSMGIWIVISIILFTTSYWLIHILPDSVFTGWSHHADQEEH